MYLVNLFIIIEVISTSHSYEAETEHLLKMEREFMNKTVHNLNNIQDKQTEQSKSKHPKKFSQVSTKVATETEYVEKLTDYLEHIKKEGIKTLNFIGKDIMRDINQEEVMEKINNASKMYETKLQNYFDYISGPNATVIYNEAFILLDICEIACRIVYHQQRRMLANYIIAKNFSNMEDSQEYSESVEAFYIGTEKTSAKAQIESIKNITETIFNYNTDLRKKEMKYICKKYNICRPYPAFTDYCGYFISEILRLPSGKFQIITKLLAMVIRLNDNVTSFIPKITDFDKFTSDTYNTCNNETKIQETLKLLKAVLSQKFSIIRNPGLNLNIRAPAIRLLMDIIDQSIKGKHLKEFIIDFDATVTAVKKWVNDEIPGIALDLANLLNKIFSMLNNIINSVKTDIKNVMILIEMVRDGNSAEYIRHNS